MQESPIVTPLNPQTLRPLGTTENPAPSSKSPALYLLFLAVIIGGIITGFLLSRRTGSVTGSSVVSGGKDIVKTQNEVGSTDTKTFGDSATGVIETGGFNGEGTHKLTRDGGPSQTVYLVSSLVDLDQYVGKKVQIWGQTLKAKRVGWLMDVGRLKILE